MDDYDPSASLLTEDGETLIISLDILKKELKPYILGIVREELIRQRENIPDKAKPTFSIIKNEEDK